MRSYRQYCALAKALDILGDRWTLLIVRELLLGPCRYTDLQRGLPGIATNLLADRLRDLEQAGIVRREAAAPPVATTLFSLTPRGEELREVVHAFARWGAPLMAELAEDDHYRSEWLALPAQFFLEDQAPDDPPVTIEVRAGDEPMVVETTADGIRTRRGRAEDPDAVIGGPPHLVTGVLAGLVDLPTARKRKLVFEGDPAALARLQPRATGRGRTS